MKSQWALGALFVAGCATAHPVPSGTVLMKVNAGEAHVRMAGYEVDVGDHVRLMRRDCQSESKVPMTCPERAVGEGIVTKVLNARDAVVHVEPGSDYAEGDAVEKVGGE